MEYYRTLSSKGQEPHLRVGRRGQQVAERRQSGRVPKSGLELLGGLGEGGSLGVRVGLFPQPPARPGRVYPVRTRRIRSVSGSSSSRRTCSRPAGSMAAAEQPLLGREGGGTARGGPETHFRRKGRCSALLPSPG